MEQSNKHEIIINRIIEHYPTPKLDLDYKNAFELLIALMLSARCTDKLTNKITKELFHKFKAPEDFIKAGIDRINKEISSCSMHNTKAKRIFEVCKILTEKYSSTVPNNLEELLKLPGVARKTANILLSFAFGIPAIGVDTHVRRVSNRLGISSSEKADKIEEDIKKICPKKEWIRFYSGLTLFGRYICRSKNPKCTECFLNDICQYYKKEHESQN